MGKGGEGRVRKEREGGREEGRKDVVPRDSSLLPLLGVSLGLRSIVGPAVSPPPAPGRRGLGQAEVPNRWEPGGFNRLERYFFIFPSSVFCPAAVVDAGARYWVPLSWR